MRRQLLDGASVTSVAMGLPAARHYSVEVRYVSGFTRVKGVIPAPQGIHDQISK